MSINRAKLHDLYVLDNSDRTALNFPSPREGAVFFEKDTGDAFIWVQGDWEPLGSGGGGGAVDSVFGRTGVVVAQANDYTWAQIDKTVSDIADITSRSHTDLTDIGSNTHAQIDTHIADLANPHNVTAAQANALAIANNLSDLGDAATARTNLGLVAGGTGDIWVEKAGDTMTGNLLISGGSLAVTGAITATAGLIVEGAAIFNSSGGIFDFRIDANVVDSIFFVDASEDRIGIGTSSPVAPFHAALSEAFNPWGSVSGARTGYAWFGDGTSSTDIMIQSNGRSAITFDNGSVAADLRLRGDDVFTFEDYTSGGAVLMLSDLGANSDTTPVLEISKGDEIVTLKTGSNTRSFVIEGDGSTTAMALLNTSGNTAQIYFDSVDGDLSGQDYGIINYATNQAFQFINYSAGGFEFFVTSATGPTGILYNALDITVNNGVVVNEIGNANIDFRVESGNYANMFRVNGGLDGVGIGVAAPDSELHIGGVNATPYFIIQSNSTSSTAEAYINMRVHSSDSGYRSAFRSRRNSTSFGTQLWIGVTDNISSQPILYPVIVSYDNVRPNNDNAYGLGQSGNRWVDVWAVDSTINTSDRRKKTDIATSDLGLDFIQQLKPISYRRKDEMFIDEITVVGDDGKEKESTRERLVTYKRRHYGLVAQDVEGVLAGKDFAGLIKDRETGLYGLRYEEFISPMIRAIQELTAKVASLEAQLEKR
jgi:hypothetical protein